MVVVDLLEEGRVERVQVDSSTRMGWARSPSIMGSCPLMATLSFVFLISTIRSLPFRFPGISIVMSRSPMV